MNIKTKIKFLRLRQRADRFELECFALRDQIDQLHDKINDLARERGRAEADMIRRHAAELAVVRASTSVVTMAAGSGGGTGGVVFGVDPIAPARSWVSGSGSSGPIGGRVRTDDERRTEQ